MNKQQTLFLASILGALAVSIGAFGAHGLESTLVANGRVETFEVGTKYFFYHTIALFITGLLMKEKENAWFKRASILFTVGIIIFSGSLFTLSITNIRWLGAITPIGGVGFILGWLFLALGVNKK
ncbi:DUF423 domain-containing protein [Sediminitomix flava]|uniref:Uncharacterized membrane protein YgdD (TMEM256/DUF423 family) n=1 Tax=Sediminitomix flava TaxID=379075 RepID=A0A315Z899_SEDFL|nr:DUF423 domain-containing protein [Sediminitomix flava]PWJ40785.1 uncharacterized membrane protein YgdD (TMEM256/DUF423 family) [Sediminitomix flava]